jgi:quercetin dioxygenase-like cupin family protein
MTATSIDAGSAQRSSLRAGAFELSDVVFPSARRLSWHEHPRACVAIVVAGAVRKRFAGSEDELREGGVVAMPPEEPHEDVFGADGARLVVIEADDGVRRVSCRRS